MKWLWGIIAVVAAVAVGVVIGFNCGGKSKMSDIKKQIQILLLFWIIL